MSAANFILKTTYVRIRWNPKEAWECRVFRLRLPKAKAMAVRMPEACLIKYLTVTI